MRRFARVLAHRPMRRLGACRCACWAQPSTTRCASLRPRAASSRPATASVLFPSHLAEPYIPHKPTPPPSSRRFSSTRFICRGHAVPLGRLGGAADKRFSLGLMKRYPWSCPACGAPNDAAVDACFRCSCPAQATYKQMERHRSSFLEGGEEVGPAAAELAGPIDLEMAARALLLPIGLIFGFWPFSKRDNK